MQFRIITIFPNIFNSYFTEGILGRARKMKKIKIKIYNLRDWALNKHKTVDDTPYGGGAGMIMKADIIYKAIQKIKSEIRSLKLIKNSKVILLSARGKKWNQQLAKKYAELDNIIFVCGRYEGVDERVKEFIDEEISIGNYVLTGGEIGAMAIIDSITRLLPGVLGNTESLKSESHSVPGILEYPQYTRPEVISCRGKKLRVPKILLSGNHSEIDKWREKRKKLEKK